MVELEILFIQLFPESGTRSGPFTLKEIALILTEAYGFIPYSRVHRAWGALSDNEHTRELVRPLAGDERYLQFDVAAARRIARRVVSAQLPTKYKNGACAKDCGVFKKENRKRKLNVIKTQNGPAAASGTCNNTCR